MPLAARLLPAVLSLLGLSAVAADEAPQWIWAETDAADESAIEFQKTFVTEGKVTAAGLSGVADFCEITVTLNDVPLDRIESYSGKFQWDIAEHVRPGKNRLRVYADHKESGAPHAVALTLTLTDDSGPRTISTDKTWTALTNRQDVVETEELGALEDEPWGDHPDTVTIQAQDDYTQWKQALGADGKTDPTGFFTLPGFQIELLRKAKPEEGSWVSMEFDPKGRLIIAREDKGLLRLTFDANRQVEKVETINDTLLECRGLLYAYDALYAHANNSNGLYRLRDADGDDRFDEVKLLQETSGGVGHGRNDLALGPDGMIYAIHGDDIEPPPGVPTRCSPYQKFGQQGRHGFVMRLDKDGQRREIVASGMRNPYGIAFNADGEMFTYDADAEYDMGSSWYRPTRILHLLPGADFGWRAVTGTWPPYNPDVAEAAPPALDIGKGSPTAVKFGAGSHFPPKYQRALFALDWAYGRILAVHMQPRGAGYAMRAETFVKGRPFNVTDLGIGPDGAMYVVTGGRKTQAGLYRIRYVGELAKEPAPTRQQQARESYAAAQRRLRRKLEAIQNPNTDPEYLEAFSEVNYADPWLRYAARIGLEHLQGRRSFVLLADIARPLKSLTRQLAVALDTSLEEGSQDMWSWDEYDMTERMLLLRILQLRSAQSRVPKASLARLLDAQYPADSFPVNQRLSELLVELNADITARTLDLLDKTTEQRERFHFLYLLRNVKQGWTPGLRERYFRGLARMSNFTGGDGMPVFIQRIQQEALASIPEAERAPYAAMLQRQRAAIEIPQEALNRPFVRKWQVAELNSELPDAGNFSVERGRKLFDAAACSACHRVGGHGYPIGPELTSVGRRFSRQDILTSIIEPSKVVAEQYRQDTYVTTAGKIVTGLTLPGGDFRSPELRVQTSPLQAESVVTLLKSEIEEHRKSESSLMPAGLLDTLSREEITELLAWLAAGGDPQHPLYRDKVTR